MSPVTSRPSTRKHWLPGVWPGRVQQLGCRSRRPRGRRRARGRRGRSGRARSSPRSTASSCVLHVDRDVDVLEQLGDAGDRRGRTGRPRRGRRGSGWRARPSRRIPSASSRSTSSRRGVGRVDEQRLARLAVPIGVDEVGHLARRAGPRGRSRARRAAGGSRAAALNRSLTLPARLSGVQPARSCQAGVVREDLDDREPQADPPLEPLDGELLVPQHERDDHAALAGAGGAAGAVEVGLVVLGRVVVDDDVDAFDVETPGGHVGRDEGGSLPGGEVGERPLPEPLAQVAVDGRGPHTRSRASVVDEAVGAALGADEARASCPRPSTIAAATLALSIWWTFKKRCSISSTVTWSETDLVEDRVAAGSGGRAGRRPSRAWPRTSRVWRARRHLPQQPLDLGHEAHVGHPVGLVDDEGRDLVEVDRLAVREVDQPPRRRHDDVEPPLRAGWPACRGRPRRRRRRPGARRPAERLEHLGHLDARARGSGRARARSAASGRAGGVRISIGRPKASVLPEPVFALPQTSRPASASAIVSAWTGKGRVIPADASAATSGGVDAERGECRKVGVAHRVRSAATRLPPGARPASPRGAGVILGRDQPTRAAGEAPWRSSPPGTRAPDVPAARPGRVEPSPSATSPAGGSSSTSTRSDDTPGCTKEACQFSDLVDGFAALGVEVVGISPDDAASHQRSAQRTASRITPAARTPPTR